MQNYVRLAMLVGMLACLTPCVSARTVDLDTTEYEFNEIDELFGTDGDKFLTEMASYEEHRLSQSKFSWLKRVVNKLEEKPFIQRIGSAVLMKMLAFRVIFRNSWSWLKQTVGVKQQ